MAWALVLLGASPVSLTAQEASCRWAGDQPASLGIGTLRCIGGDCEINMRADDGGLEHRFSTTPRVEELRPPASDALRDGDIIESVDGEPITSRRGGRRLARLTVGVPTALGIRRGDSSRTVRLTPVPGCPTGSLSVRRGPAG